MSIQKALEDTKKLNSRERALLAHCLISSLETEQDDGVDDAWFQLAEKRIKELRSGAVTAMTWQEIKQQVKG